MSMSTSDRFYVGKIGWNLRWNYSTDAPFIYVDYLSYPCLALDIVLSLRYFGISTAYVFC
jgi:hypothetical protein